jgi:CubicO group peptidase (beta-lactamase class C family)
VHRHHYPASAVLLTCLMALLAVPARAQHDGSLTERVERAVVEEGLVGVTWSLVTPDGVTLGAAGIRDASLGTRLDPGDRVHVGSVAKTLIATGMLALVTEGRLALDAHVSELLPELRMDNPWNADAPLRVRHLLDHGEPVHDDGGGHVRVRAIPDE